MKLVCPFTTPWKFTLQPANWDTPCTVHIHTADGGKRVHLSHTYCWRLKGIHTAHPYCWQWKSMSMLLILLVLKGIHVQTAGCGKWYTLHVVTQLLMLLLLLNSVEKSRVNARMVKKVSLSSAFLQVINCLGWHRILASGSVRCCLSQTSPTLPSYVRLDSMVRQYYHTYFKKQRVNPDRRGTTCV